MLVRSFIIFRSDRSVGSSDRYDWTTFIDGVVSFLAMDYSFSAILIPFVKNRYYLRSNMLMWECP